MPFSICWYNYAKDKRGVFPGLYRTMIEADEEMTLLRENPRYSCFFYVAYVEDSLWTDLVLFVQPVTRRLSWKFWFIVIAAAWLALAAWVNGFWPLGTGYVCAVAALFLQGMLVKYEK